MAKRTDTKIAILVQVMDELGFDRETVAKVSRVPQRTVSDIISGINIPLLVQPTAKLHQLLVGSAETLKCVLIHRWSS